MEIQKYMSYLQPIAGGVLFLALALWVLLSGERAMERSRKPLGWMSAYRRPGFPLGQQMLAARGPGWLLPVLAALAGICFALIYRLLLSQIVLDSWLVLVKTRYTLFTLVFAALGGVAVCLLLQQLFDDRTVTVLGTLLFCGSPLGWHMAGCLLAAALWLLLRYLLCENAGLKAELWYFAAALLLALAIAVEPVCAVMGLLLVAAHWYRHGWMLGNNRQRFGGFCLAMGLSLLVWILCAVGAALLRQFMLGGFRLSMLRRFASLRGLRLAGGELLRTFKTTLLAPLGLGRLLPPLMDAPLAMLGLAGAVSALRMVLRRRNPRGVLALAVLCVSGLCWVLGGRWIMGPGLVLCAGCLLSNGQIGRRRAPAIVYTVLGVLFDLGLYLAQWYVTANPGILERLR